MKLLKKLSIFAGAAALMMGITVISVSAATYTVGDFTVDRSYSYGGYTTSISAYNGAGGAITLPDKVDVSGTEYDIEETGTAFKNNELITSVVIPEGYTTITANSFSGCANLESVTIAGSVTQIGASAFENCPKLTTVTFADDTASSLNILNAAFSGDTALTSLELPARLSIGRYNFVRGCTSLSSLTVKAGSTTAASEDNVLYIISGGEASLVAYAEGKTDKEFTIPSAVNGNSVTAIRMHAFRGNGTLEKVTIPASVTDIGGYAFTEMSAVKEIVLEHETAPALSSDAFTNLKAGSVITVQNDTVAAALEPERSYSSYTYYYTADNTTVKIAGQAYVEATLSIEAEDELNEDGEAVYNIYLSEAENVNTLNLKIAFDKNQVNKGVFTVVKDDVFDITTANTWSDELVLTASIGISGNQTGYTADAKTKIATITVPVKDGVTGKITAIVTKAEIAGITDTEADAVKGTVTIAPDTAEIFIASYDVNGDGKVDILDLTEAQRYYQATSADANWASKAYKMDVNGDNKVDIADYVAIFKEIDF